MGTAELTAHGMRVGFRRQSRESIGCEIGPRNVLGIEMTDRGFAEQDRKPLGSQIESTLHSYFENLDGHSTCDLYRLVMSEVEKPLLKLALDHAHGNQTRAAKILGINRATLRKKLRQYGIG